MAVPEVAINMVVTTVDKLSQDFLLTATGGDWDTIVHFASMLEGTTIRYTLAQIAVALRQENPDWGGIVKKIGTLEESEVIPVPSSLNKYAAMQQDVADMLSIEREDDERLAVFLEEIRKEYGKEDDKLYAILESLVDAYKEGKEDALLSDRPFARDFLVTKFRKWFKKSLRELGDAPMSRSVLEYQNNKRKRGAQETRARVKGLRRARTHLRNSVDDPLAEAREVGKQAKSQQEGTLYSKKKSATRLSFGNSQEEEDEEIDDPEEGAHGTHQLSEVPEKMKYRSPKKPAKNVSTKSPGSARKQKWTQEQKTAFKAALKDYGKGNWAEIRDAAPYRQYWEGRTNVDVKLKDLYRSMKKQGEIDDDLV